jgi:hypothetical protein
MTAIILILIILTLYLVYKIKEAIPPKFTKEDFQYMSDMYIIRNKEEHTKLAIQKAQQRIDEYLQGK